MDRAEVEELVQRWVRQTIVEGRLDTFHELLTRDVVDRSRSALAMGVESFKARAAAVGAAFADIEVVVDALVVEGDAIAWRWTLTGTHVGPFAGASATGRRVTLQGVNFQRLRDGRVAEHWTQIDVLGALQALRSTP